MQRTPWKFTLGAVLSAGLIAAPLNAVPANAVEVSPAAAGSSPITINEAYLSGGSAGAAYKNKFVELYNSSDTPVSLEGWSLQYRAASATGAPSYTGQLSGTVPAKGYFLVKGGTNSTASTAPDLPSPDVSATGFAPSATAGTIVLARQSTAVNPLPTGSVVEQDNVADLLGYGTSNTFETQAAAAPPSTTDVRSLNRTSGRDSNNNATDFTLSAAITPGAANLASGTAPSEPADPAPGAASKTIAEIQGTGTASPLAGSAVTTRGRVTAVFPTGGFAGYYLQTPGTGGDLTPANHAASDAVFVFSPSTVDGVRAGEYVEITGTVSEFYGM